MERFLRERHFGSEHLNLEFKRDFPGRKDGRVDYREVCSYIVGFSNADGGIIVYGVENRIRDRAVSFPEYIFGVGQRPTLEDLSEWAKNFVWPLLHTAGARSFTVTGKLVWILRIPPGENPPCCFWDPKTNDLLFTKKTPAGLATLRPEQVRILYQEAIVTQARRLTEALSGAGRSQPEELRNKWLKKHQALVLPKLEDIQNFGHLAIYCLPGEHLQLDLGKLSEFLERHRFDFSESVRYSPRIETFQNGVSAGYYPTAIRNDIKSTIRVTLNSDGLVAFDAQAEPLMNGSGILNPKWLAYELQRHLQLAKALLAEYGVDDITVLSTSRESRAF